jgi:hypothetical protein
LNIVGLLVIVLNWFGHGRTPLAFRVFESDAYGAQPPPVQAALQRFEVEDVLVAVHDPSLPQRILELIGTGTLTFAVTLVLAVLAQRTVDAAIRSDPFTPDMAGRLTRLGRAVLIGGFGSEAIRLTAGIALYRSAHGTGYAINAQTGQLGAWWLLLGLAVLGFAAVVRHGCALRAELDEVI